MSVSAPLKYASLLPYLIRVLKSKLSEMIIFIILLAIIIIAGLLSPTFLQPVNLSNVMRQASVLGIVSIGQTIVILTAGINLSVGALITSSVVLTAGIMMGRSDWMVPAIVLVLSIGFAVGWLSGKAITKFGAPDFAITLGIRSILIGGTFLYCGGREIGYVTPTFRLLAGGNIGYLPIPMVLWMCIVTVSWIFLRFMPWGRYIYAVGGGEKAARLTGINVDFIKILAYSICGLTAAVAGIILASRLGVGFPLAGEAFLLDSIATVCIGGTSLFGGRGTIWGTVAGVFIISILNNIFNLLEISPFTQQVFKGVIVIAAVAVWAQRKKE